MNCKCGKEIPKKRVELGFSYCVDCSTEEQKEALDIVFHKTGNTIEVVDKDSAKAIKKLSKRNGFGIMAGMKQSKSNTYNPKNVKHGCSTSFIGSEESFEKVGKEMIEQLEFLDRSFALKVIDKAKQDIRINNKQYNRLLKILNELSPEEVVEVRISKKNIKPVDEEVQWAFRNWKNSKHIK